MIAAPITVVPTRDDDVIDNTDADALVHRGDDDDLSDDDDVPALVPVPDVIVRPDVLTVRPVMSRGVLNRANIFAHASAFSIAYSIKDPYAISWFFPAAWCAVSSTWAVCVLPACTAVPSRQQREQRRLSLPCWPQHCREICVRASVAQLEARGLFGSDGGDLGLAVDAAATPRQQRRRPRITAGAKRRGTVVVASHDE